LKLKGLEWRVKVQKSQAGLTLWAGVFETQSQNLYQRGHRVHRGKHRVRHGKKTLNSRLPPSVAFLCVL